MTNTGTEFTAEHVAEMSLRTAQASFDQVREDVAVRVAQGDFRYATSWSMEEGVRLQMRLRVLEKVAAYGGAAVVSLLAPVLGDTSQPGDLFGRAVQAAERVEALHLLRFFQPYLTDSQRGELLSAMV